MPEPNLVATGNDQLPLFFVALSHLLLVMGRSVAEHPDPRLVVEVRLAVDARNLLLGGVRQPQPVLVKVLDEFALGRRVGIQVAEHVLVLFPVVLESRACLDLDIGQLEFAERIPD